MCKLLGIEKTRSSTFHPQGNGFIERQNTTIIKMLDQYVSSNQKDWDVHLDLVMLAYRSSVHSSTGYIPSILHIGRELRPRIDLVLGSPQVKNVDDKQTKTGSASLI